MKRYLRWIVAAEFLFAAGNLHAVEVEVPGLLTDHTVHHLVWPRFSGSHEMINGESDYYGNLHAVEVEVPINDHTGPVHINRGPVHDGEAGSL